MVEAGLRGKYVSEWDGINDCISFSEYHDTLEKQETLHLAINECRYVIEHGIDAAWTTFDLEDRATWPKSEYAPSGKAWLWMDSEGYFEVCPWFGTAANIIGSHMEKYADPADLMSSKKRPVQTEGENDA